MSQKHEIASYIGYLLASRMHTEWELREKVKKKFKEREEESLKSFEEILADLKKKKLVDDELFTKMYLEYEIATHFRGKMGYWQKLMKRGVAKDIFEAVWEELDPNEYILAHDLLHQQSFRFEGLDKQKRREKVQRFLAGRGFGYDVVRDLL